MQTSRCQKLKPNLTSYIANAVRRHDRPCSAISCRNEGGCAGDPWPATPLRAQKHQWLLQVLADPSLPPNAAPQPCRDTEPVLILIEPAKPGLFDTQLRNGTVLATSTPSALDKEAAPLLPQ
jgi:hypothetical protein